MQTSTINEHKLHDLLGRTIVDTKDVATWVARVCTIVYFLFFFLMPWYTARDTAHPVPERVTA